MSQPPFSAVRDVVVQVARGALVVDVEVLERAIAEGERSLEVAPIVDPTLYRDAGPELERELGLMRALLAFRQAIEALRPAEPQEPGA